MEIVFRARDEKKYERREREQGSSMFDVGKASQVEGLSGENEDGSSTTERSF